MKTTRNRSPGTNQPIVNRTRNTSAITFEHTVKTTARERMNEYWRQYYAKNKGRIRQRLPDQRQRDKDDGLSYVLRPEDQESEKLETSPVPSVRLCQWNTNGQDYSSAATTRMSEKADMCMILDLKGFFVNKTLQRVGFSIRGRKSLTVTLSRNLQA